MSIAIVKKWLDALYAKYVELWKEQHEFVSGESEPACFAEWYWNEFVTALTEIEEVI